LGRLGTVGSVVGLALVSTFTQSAIASAQTTSVDTSSLQKLSDGLAYYALLTCIGGIVISAAMWAMGSKGQNAGTELVGKKGFVVCLTAAFFIGAVNPMVNWLNQKASSSDVDTAGVTTYQPYAFNGGTDNGGFGGLGGLGDLGGAVGQVGGDLGAINAGAGIGQAIGDIGDELNQQAQQQALNNVGSAVGNVNQAVIAQQNGN
jgi:hypothetical protein